MRMRREAGDTPNVAATQQHRNTTVCFAFFDLWECTMPLEDAIVVWTSATGRSAMQATTMLKSLLLNYRWARPLHVHLMVSNASVSAVRLFKDSPWHRPRLRVEYTSRAPAPLHGQAGSSQAAGNQYWSSCSSSSSTCHTKRTHRL